MKLDLASAASLCRVWVGSQPCVFGTSVFDTFVASRSSTSSTTTTSTHHRNHYDRALIGLKEKEDIIQLLAAGCSDSFGGGGGRQNDNLPFGRARDCPILQSTSCPTTIPGTQKATTSSDNNKKPFVGLAVVGMAMDVSADGDERLLITRRPSYMRSFPGAWVFPGGSVDPGESLEAAMSREMEEETGLSIPIKDWELQSIWESVYPTIPEAGVAIRAHHIVVYLSARIDRPQQQQEQLQLCPEEVDGATWLSRKHMHAIVDGMSLSLDGQKKTLSERLDDGDTLQLFGSPADETSVSIKEFFGIYPQQYGGNMCGMAQGSLFALEEFLDSRKG